MAISDSAALVPRVSAAPKNPLETQVGHALEYFLSRIPGSEEPAATNPATRSRQLVDRAAWKAGLLSGGMAIPPGPLGLLTVLPDVVAIWRIQAQMAADIAACYGQTSHLTRDEMLYCLFKHTASQYVRHLVVTSGGRVLVRRAALRVGDEVLCKVGLRCAQRLTTRGLIRALPLMGAAAVGAYAFYDTRQVGRTCCDLFSQLDPAQVRLYEVEELDQRRP
ncbi:MAG: hypothetical protein AAGK14_06130 [Verrucomicrobiota bacterium]